MRPIPPKTGDIFLAKLDPVKGSEQGKERPVIVFQNPDLTIFTSTYLCIPLTTNLSRNGFIGTCLIGNLWAAILFHGTFNFITASKAGEGIAAALVSAVVIIWAVCIIFIYKPETLSCVSGVRR